jgi:hypothetical protein
MKGIGHFMRNFSATAVGTDSACLTQAAQGVTLRVRVPSRLSCCEEDEDRLRRHT